MSKALQKMDLRAPKTEGRSEIHMETWFTRAHKAAIVLASLSAEAAAEIVDEMSDDELRNFAKAFSELKTVSPQLLEAVAEEFLAAASSPEQTDLSGGSDEARRVLTMMAKEERAERILADMGGGGDSAVWTRVEKVDDEVLAQYVQAQRMPIAATILSKLSYEKTAAVLNLADAEYSQKVLLEVARKKPSSPDAIEAIANVLEEELLKPAPGASAEEEGDEDAPAAAAPKGNAGAKVGEIINYLPGVKRDALLEHFKQIDPEVGAEVRRAVLTFEELYTRMPASGATALLRDLDRDVLLKAIKYGEGNAPETVEFLFGNISKRMVEQYKEELAEMETPSEEDGEGAQREVTTTVRELVAAGEFKLIPLKEPDAEESA
ncbi:FliG C-terminal domain-containing protein [Hyphococcus sp.]|jgi:flagellar motor switch protein FliG|uniref:FliG C-terminal domain-containing protein n=1 Tax=Hyphococcus sp. TaxID=2038636 RepID=UPI003D14CBC5